MPDFQNPPLVRDVADARSINTASPRALLIAVRYARQLAATGSFKDGDTLMIFSGLIRFGQDGDSKGEDPRNESSLYSEVDGVGTNSPRTVMLQLRGPALTDSQFVGSNALAALADVFLTTSDTFGAATDTDAALLKPPLEDGNELARDLWFFSDVSAERATGASSQINRMTYHANVLLARRRREVHFGILEGVAHA